MIGLVLTLLVVGVVLWLLNEHVPLDPKIRRIINVVVLVCVVVWLLHAFGILKHGDIPVPQFR